MNDPSTPEPSSRLRSRDVIVLLACACVIVAGLRAAAVVLVPAAVAIMLALACRPAVDQLERLGVPSGLAIVAVLLVVVAALMILPLIVGTSLSAFQEALPGYRDKMGPWLTGIADQLRGLGFDVPENPRLVELYDTGALFQLVADATVGIVRVLSNAMIVLLVTVFALLEARLLPQKLDRAFGSQDAAQAFAKIVERVGRYVSVKTMTSLLTGTGCGVLCALFGVDFPLLWGFVAFAFNFIPNIGSILAAVPPILLAALESGFGSASLLGASYVAINMSISNGLEPQLMGSKLGLSTFVVFLSLLFWFWVWGPMGMLLSAPLTMILKIVLEQSDELRPFAVMLGRGEPVRS